MGIKTKKRKNKMDKDGKVKDSGGQGKTMGEKIQERQKKEGLKKAADMYHTRTSDEI